MTSKENLTLGIVGVGVIIILLTLILVPTVIGFYSDDQTTLNQTTGQKYEVVSNLTSELNTNTSNPYVNLSYAGETRNLSFNLASGFPVEKSTTIGGENVTVNMTEGGGTGADGYAVLTYTFSSTWGVPSNVVSLISMTIILIFIGLVLAVVKPFD